MKLIPVITEKSLTAAKNGVYTFWVDLTTNKHEIKKAVEDLFKVHVQKVRTINLQPRVKRNYQRRLRKVKGQRKAMVTLAEKEKIDLFEEKK